MAFIKNTLHNKRYVFILAVTASLFLLFLGMRVPNLSKPHPPKPRPRAVFEASVKAGQAVETRAHDEFATGSLAPVLHKPTPLRKLSQQKTSAGYLTALDHGSSRAPPVTSSQNTLVLPV